ncbi:hypothetical protein DQ04_02211080 [Trypanosoma grayi]|uniref:hypothetical protein n=1 Tax=Trypanosoma grayi TaxID=71804 RepID=UPI0004F408F3|nr:hypothetical protein DQ04_02211080 [Trypanosoma grayi]KEG11859.1 hypothetical protein DQ04_02211080 [Trypanosoma grayi]
MESRAYEVYLTALQEQRRLLLLLKSMWGVHAVLLRLSQERHAEQYAERPLSLFVAHNVSLHQWVDANSARPTRHTAVFYALPPHRSNELPYEQLEAVLIAKAKMSGSTFDVIDLRPLAAGGAQLSGGAVRFSANGEFMYVCCGTTGCDAEVRASTLRIVDALRSGLGVSSSNCFCYYASPDAAATGGGLGWAAVGICAWALDEMSFDSAAERQRFVSHLREAYRTSLHLTRADVQNFAGECVEIVSRSPRHGSPKRQLVISSGALRALSEDNRAALTAWYNNGGCVVPDVTTVERVGGYSVASMMIAVVTHGAETPPPTARGLLASSGIGQCE